MEDITLPEWVNRLADIENLPDGFESIKTYLRENDLSKVVDFEDREYQNLKFVRVYQKQVERYGNITYSVLEIELNAAKMYFGMDWEHYVDLGKFMKFLEAKRCCYRYV